MSKIIKKRDLDLVVESTMKEAGLVSEEDVKYGSVTPGDDSNPPPCEECGNEECTCETTDSVDESAEELAESIHETTKNLISEDMELFNKLINYRNK
jgi:hypothetical protein